LKFYKAAGGWTFRRQEEARLHLWQEHEIMDPDEDNGMCPGENSTAVSPSNTSHTAPFVAGLKKANNSRSSNGSHDGDHVKANSLSGAALSGIDTSAIRTPRFTKPAILTGREITETSNSDDELSPSLRKRRRLYRSSGASTTEATGPPPLVEESPQAGPLDSLEIGHMPSMFDHDGKEQSDDEPSPSLRKRRRLHRNSDASTTEATGPPPLVEESTQPGHLDSLEIGHMPSMFDHDGGDHSDPHPNHPSAIPSAEASVVRNSPTNDARHWAGKEASYKQTVALLVADHDRVVRAWEDERAVLMAERDEACALQRVTELSRHRVADILIQTRNMIHEACGIADSETRLTLQALGTNIERSLYEEDLRVAREREELGLVLGNN
jgi:hypothetical protein